MHPHERPFRGAAKTVTVAGLLICVHALQASAQSAAAPAPAGKRVCKPRIEWTSIAGTRAEAQRKAVEGWASAAIAAHGEGFSKWAIAGIARVGCTLTPEGQRCRAAASPCRDLNEDAKPSPKR